MILNAALLENSYLTEIQSYLNHLNAVSMRQQTPTSAWTSPCLDCKDCHREKSVSFDVYSCCCVVVCAIHYKAHRRRDTK